MVWISLGAMRIRLLAGRQYLRYWRTARSGARQRRGGLETGDQHHTGKAEIDVVDETQTGIQ